MSGVKCECKKKRGKTAEKKDVKTVVPTGMLFKENAVGELPRQKRMPRRFLAEPWFTVKHCGSMVEGSKLHPLPRLLQESKRATREKSVWVCCVYFSSEKDFANLWAIRLGFVTIRALCIFCELTWLR